jgi:hypothetical protein
MITKLFDEIGIAYAENKRKYPDRLIMNHLTYGMIMGGRVPEDFPKRSLNRDDHTILGIRVIFDEQVRDNAVEMFYRKKVFSKET